MPAPGALADCVYYEQPHKNTQQHSAWAPQFTEKIFNEKNWFEVRLQFIDIDGGEFDGVEKL